MINLIRKSKSKAGATVRFIPSETKSKNFDFFKTKDGYEFEIKASQDNEELRIHGCTIEQNLHLAQQTLLIENGENREVYALVEGLLLSSYRFDKYFSQKEILMNYLDTK